MSGTGICLEKNLLCFVMDCEFDPISQCYKRENFNTKRWNNQKSFLITNPGRYNCMSYMACLICI